MALGLDCLCVESEHKKRDKMFCKITQPLVHFDGYNKQEISLLLTAMILQPEYFLAFTIILLDKLKLEVIMLS